MSPLQFHKPDLCSFERSSYWKTRGIISTFKEELFLLLLDNFNQGNAKLTFCFSVFPLKDNLLQHNSYIDFAITCLAFELYILQHIIKYLLCTIPRFLSLFTSFLFSRLILYITYIALHLHIQVYEFCLNIEKYLGCITISLQRLLLYFSYIKFIPCIIAFKWRLIYSS